MSEPRLVGYPVGYPVLLDQFRDADRQRFAC
jgi:hypothetical protein